MTRLLRVTRIMPMLVLALGVVTADALCAPSCGNNQPGHHAKRLQRSHSTGPVGEEPMPMMLVWRKERCLMWATLVCAALLAPGLAWAQAPCTHYAAPSRRWQWADATTAFRVSHFWAVAGPGKTLCLLDGAYTGSESMIEPPPTLHGTAAQPITVRALHDGKVLIDAQGLWAMRLRGQWWVVEGINARNGGEFLLSLSGAHNRARRIIGWNGTHGQDDSNIWRVVGHDNIAEDVAGLGGQLAQDFRRGAGRQRRGLAAFGAPGASGTTTRRGAHSPTRRIRSPTTRATNCLKTLSEPGTPPGTWPALKPS